MEQQNITLFNGQEIYIKNIFYEELEHITAETLWTDEEKWNVGEMESNRKKLRKGNMEGINSKEWKKW